MRRLCLNLSFVAAVLCPSIASAQWFVNPYVGKLHDATYETSTGQKPTVIGVAGGTSPFKRFGLEIDFAHASKFWSEADYGSNNVRSLTVAVHGGPAISIGGRPRLRPYGVAGGGIGILKRTDFELDFDVLDTLPPAQQIAILNCAFSEDIGSPTLAQLTACGAPVLGEEETGVTGIATFGGGILASLTKNLGARADFRYVLRMPQDDDEKFHYWRFTFGVVIHR